MHSRPSRHALRWGRSLLVAAIALTGVVPWDAAGAGAPGPRPRPSDGCESPTAVAPGEEEITTTSDGVERRYIRHVPPAHGSEPVPLVLDFHGYSEGARIHVTHSGLGALGDAEGFVTVTPQGTGALARWDATPGSADLAFVGRLLDELETTLCIDTARVYATGLSNGAMMTSAVACVFADRIAAVAPVAGVRTVEPCDPDRPVPVVAFHGTEDGYVPFDGGVGEDALDLPAPDGSGRTLRELGVGRGAGAPAVPEVMASWAERNGCRAKPRERRVSADVVLVTYRCRRSADVQLYRVEGGGHAWPGSEFSASIESVVGVTTFSVDASAVMWDFFRGHALRRTAGPG